MPKLTKKQSEAFKAMPDNCVICLPGDAPSIRIKDVCDTIDALEYDLAEAKRGRIEMTDKLKGESE